MDLAGRLARLLIGLVLFGVSLALMVRANLGLGPWDVLHQGIAGRLGWPLGTVTIAVSALVLLAWIPLRQRPGVGTVANVVIVGLAVDATLAVLPAPDLLAARIGILVAGIVLNAVASGLYIGAGLGPGPRDGLMTGLAARGVSVRLARTVIEVGALLLGIALGGTAGVGTVAYALAIGPLVQLALRGRPTSSGVGKRPTTPRTRTARTLTTRTPPAPTPQAPTPLAPTPLARTITTEGTQP